jgi:IS1 family transposase
VAKKQARLTIEERESSGSVGDIYLWTAVDQETKLVPTFAVGKRSADMARRIMVDLAGRLRNPSGRPHDSDAHAYSHGGYDPALQLSTDGFPGYPEAVDLAFGPYVKYGQLIKDYRNAKLNYTPSEMVGVDRRGIVNINSDEERTICTSHVERHNLTIRTFMKRFTRLSLGFSKKLENLAAAVGLFMAYYNYCWRPRHKGNTSRKRPTPAVAAGLVGDTWTFEKLFSEVTDRHL